MQSAQCMRRRTVVVEGRSRPQRDGPPAGAPIASFRAMLLQARQQRSMQHDRTNTWVAKALGLESLTRGVKQVCPKRTACHNSDPRTDTMYPGPHNEHGLVVRLHRGHDEHVVIEFRAAQLQQRSHRALCVSIAHLSCRRPDSLPLGRRPVGRRLHGCEGNVARPGRRGKFEASNVLHKIHTQRPPAQRSHLCSFLHGRWKHEFRENKQVCLWDSRSSQQRQAWGVKARRWNRSASFEFAVQSTRARNKHDDENGSPMGNKTSRFERGLRCCKSSSRVWPTRMQLLHDIGRLPQCSKSNFTCESHGKRNQDHWKATEGWDCKHNSTQHHTHGSPGTHNHRTQTLRRRICLCLLILTSHVFITSSDGPSEVRGRKQRMRRVAPTQVSNTSQYRSTCIPRTPAPSLQSSLHKNDLTAGLSSQAQSCRTRKKHLVLLHSLSLALLPSSQCIWHSCASSFPQTPTGALHSSFRVRHFTQIHSLAFAARKQRQTSDHSKEGVRCVGTNWARLCHTASRLALKQRVRAKCQELQKNPCLDFFTCCTNSNIVACVSQILTRSEWQSNIPTTALNRVGEPNQCCADLRRCRAISRSHIAVSQAPRQAPQPQAWLVCERPLKHGARPTHGHAVVVACAVNFEKLRRPIVVPDARMWMYGCNEVARHAAEVRGCNALQEYTQCPPVQHNHPISFHFNCAAKDATIRVLFRPQKTRWDARDLKVPFLWTVHHATFDLCVCVLHFEFYKFHWVYRTVFYLIHTTEWMISARSPVMPTISVSSFVICKNVSCVYNG